MFINLSPITTPVNSGVMPNHGPWISLWCRINAATVLLPSASKVAKRDCGGWRYHLGHCVFVLLAIDHSRFDVCHPGGTFLRRDSWHCGGNTMNRHVVGDYMRAVGLVVIVCLILFGDALVSWLG
jgi:hypothetical protein